MIQNLELQRNPGLTQCTHMPAARHQMDMAHPVKEQEDGQCEVAQIDTAAISLPLAK